MPDWSYHTIFKPILHKLPPLWGREFIHRGMNTISSIPGGKSFIEFLGHMDPSKELGRNIFNTHFSTPVGLSGKIDPELSGLKAFQHLGFGFVEVGPISINGTQNQALSLDKQSEKITFPKDCSIDLKSAITKLKTITAKEIPYLIRLDGAFEEILYLAKSLVSYGDAFIINKTAYSTSSELNEIKKYLHGKSLIISLTASDYFESSTELYDSDVEAIMLEEEANLQSKEQFDLLLKAVTKIRRDRGLDFPILSIGGIKEPIHAITLLQQGASLVLLSYEYVFTGPGLPKRINEAYASTIVGNDAKTSGWVWYWLFGLCILVGGILALMFSMTQVILPYDESFLGIFRGDIIGYNPLILYFMAHDRMTLAGTMISGGILYMQLAHYGIRSGLHWARRATNIAGILGFLGIFMFIGYGYFDWLHGLFWLILLPLFILGYKKTKKANRSPIGFNVNNHSDWKKSLYGQLAFVILGFSLVVGGIVISMIGTTSVFVPTDLLYMCITPEALNEFNNRLIPLIAHDRAGFGSALLSVGALVLMISLWGFREGERWVWWTITLGAIPAFLAGLVTHYIIGYTDFIHLLPAYFALFLYVVGVVLSGPYLLKKQ